MSTFGQRRQRDGTNGSSRSQQGSTMLVPRHSSRSVRPVLLCPYDYRVVTDKNQYHVNSESVCTFASLEAALWLVHSRVHGERVASLTLERIQRLHQEMSNLGRHAANKILYTASILGPSRVGSQHRAPDEVMGLVSRFRLLLTSLTVLLNRDNTRSEWRHLVELLHEQYEAENKDVMPLLHQIDRDPALAKKHKGLRSRGVAAVVTKPPESICIYYNGRDPMYPYALYDSHGRSELTGDAGSGFYWFATSDRLVSFLADFIYPSVRHGQSQKELRDYQELGYNMFDAFLYTSSGEEFKEYSMDDEINATSSSVVSPSDLSTGVHVDQFDEDGTCSCSSSERVVSINGAEYSALATEVPSSSSKVEDRKELSISTYQHHIEESKRVIETLQKQVDFLQNRYATVASDMGYLSAENKSLSTRLEARETQVEAMATQLERIYKILLDRDQNLVPAPNHQEPEVTGSAAAEPNKKVKSSAEQQPLPVQSPGSSQQGQQVLYQYNVPTDGPRPAEGSVDTVDAAAAQSNDDMTDD